MPDWLSWILDELAHLRQFPSVALVLVVLADAAERRGARR